MTEDQVMESVLLPAIRTASQRMPGLEPGSVTPETSLYGTDRAVLDSLNLVTFIFILEEEALRSRGLKIKITADDILGAESNPFESLRALSVFLREKLDAAGA